MYFRAFYCTPPIKEEQPDQTMTKPTFWVSATASLPFQLLNESTSAHTPQSVRIGDELPQPLVVPRIVAPEEGEQHRLRVPRRRCRLRLRVTTTIGGGRGRIEGELLQVLPLLHFGGLLEERRHAVLHAVPFDLAAGPDLN